MAPVLAAASTVSMASAAVSAYAWWCASRARKRAEQLSQRYADAVALIALIARAEPPLVGREVRAACERLIAKHGVEARIVSSTIH